MDSMLLQARALTRQFGAHSAVQDLNVTLVKGEILGLLGPNGAGKSTTMQMLTGNLAPTRGEIKIKGIDLLDQPQQAKQHIGYLPETPPLYRDLTVNEYLNYCAKLRHIPAKQQRTAVDYARARCQLDTVQHRLINHLSKGFRQRVGIAQAIVHQPAVVILDEPTVGLDPLQMREIRQLLRELRQEHAVILSTHILPEVQAVCDRVQMIHRGHSVFNESLATINQRLKAVLVVEFSSTDTVFETALNALPEVKQVTVQGGGVYHLHHTPTVNLAPAVAALATAQQWALKRIQPLEHSLEQVFMSLVHHDQAHMSEQEAAA